MPHEIRIPRLGWSMEEGVFVGWLKQPGDDVAVGEPLFELESDKALQPIESLDAGTLFIPPDAPTPGTTVAVGALLGYLLVGGEAAPTAPAEHPPNQPAIPPPHVAAQVAPTPSSAGPSARRRARKLNVDLCRVVGTGRHGRITCEDVEAFACTTVGMADAADSTPARRLVASPRARRVATELGVDWRSLSGTGRGGRIREADVRAASAIGTSPSAAKGQRGIPLSPRRKAIAERLRKSFARTVPVTLTTTADATNLVACRERFRTSGAAIVPAYTDIIAALVAETLTRHPQMAVRWAEDRDALITLADDELHVAIAVDTPGGLLAPVVRGVVGKSLAEISSQSRDLIDRARSGRLATADMQDAAITITNLGNFGIDAFTPIINYPQIAILGLGAIRLQPTVAPDGQIVARQTITLSLTFDHAAVDGKPAAHFLSDVAAAIASVASLSLQR